MIFFTLFFTCVCINFDVYPESCYKDEGKNYRESAFLSFFFM